MYKLAAIILSFCFSNLAQAEDVSNKDQPLALHQKAIATHKNIDLEKWLEGFKNGYISGSRGEASYLTSEQTKSRFRPYINATTFEYYRDMVDPVVKISDDGSLGWVIVQVEAKGISSGESYEFQLVWIKLHERRDAVWVQIGNVSNFKGE